MQNTSRICAKMRAAREARLFLLFKPMALFGLVEYTGWRGLWKTRGAGVLGLCKAHLIIFTWKMRCISFKLLLLLQVQNTTKHNPKHSLKQTLRLIRPNPELLGPRLTLMYVYDCVLYLPPSPRVSHRPRYPWHPWHPVFSTKPYCSKNEENGSASHVRFTFGTFPRRFRPEKKTPENQI